jgi:hypothetical protein
MKVETLTTRYDPAETEVTVTVVFDDPDMEGLELKGRLAGPCTPLAETIEVPHPLKMAAADEGLLRARVLLPDPCMWTPETPFLYRGPVEVWRHGQLRGRVQVQHGVKEMLLRQKGLRLNGEPFRLNCLQAKGVTAEDLPRLRQHGINALLMNVNAETEPLWDAAEAWGFFLIAQVDPHDEAMLWRAQEELLDHTSLFGWVLPQSLIREHQHWHNAMMLLHGQRRDVFVGVKADELPLGVLPGHVDFLLGEAETLTEAGTEKIAKIVLLKRGENKPTDPPPPHMIGWVRRSVPES